MKTSFLMAMVALAYAAQGHAQEPGRTPEEAATVKATFLITGLHCPPCTKTVETSLRHIEGVKTVKVDWKTKNARIEFDEAVLPAQKLALLIADTPHMMGKDLHYGGWLALKSPEIKDKASGAKAKEALSKVDGVKRVVAYPDKHSLGVLFDDEGEITSQQLVKELAAAGFTAAHY